MPREEPPRVYRYDGVRVGRVNPSIATEDSPSGLWRTLGKRVG